MGACLTAAARLATAPANRKVVIIPNIVDSLPMPTLRTRGKGFCVFVKKDLNRWNKRDPLVIYKR